LPLVLPSLVADSLLHVLHGFLHHYGQQQTHDKFKSVVKKNDIKNGLDDVHLKNYFRQNYE
jgi:hypothetical protein